MKRKNNLYKDICDLKNIEKMYNEVMRRTKNKNKVSKFDDFKSINIQKIYNDLNNKTYVPGEYNKFVINEPKKRDIVSLKLYDKVINHLVSRYILEPCILKSLDDCNVASRKGKRSK